MDRSSRGGGNVANALFAFSKEEENPRSWFSGCSSSGISTAGWIYETLIAGLDHPCSFRFTHKFCYRAANTFGGLIVIGISEEDGRAKAIEGEPSSSELKTRLAGSIAANISPTPVYDIAECILPADPNRRLAVIRVRPTARIHYLL